MGFPIEKNPSLDDLGDPPCWETSMYATPSHFWTRVPPGCHQGIAPGTDRRVPHGDAVVQLANSTILIFITTRLIKTIGYH